MFVVGSLASTPLSSPRWSLGRHGAMMVVSAHRLTLRSAMVSKIGVPLQKALYKLSELINEMRLH